MVTVILFSFFKNLLTGTSYQNLILQVHSPTGGVASMIGAGFVPPFIFAEEESPFRDTTSSDIRRLRQNAHSFTSMDVDDVLNIKLEHMTAGGMYIVVLHSPLKNQCDMHHSGPCK